MRLIDHQKNNKSLFSIFVWSRHGAWTMPQVNQRLVELPSNLRRSGPNRRRLREVCISSCSQFHRKKLTVGVTQLLFIVVRKVKDPNWPETNQLAIYNGDWGVMGYYEQIQLSVRAGIERRASGLQFQRPNRIATLPLGLSGL